MLSLEAVFVHKSKGTSLRKQGAQWLPSCRDNLRFVGPMCGTCGFVSMFVTNAESDNVNTHNCRIWSSDSSRQSLERVRDISKTNVSGS